MAEGIPNRSFEASQAQPEVIHDDQYYIDNYGWTPEQADRTIAWTSATTGETFETTLRDLVTQPQGTCPVDFAKNFGDAHAKDPVNGSEKHLAGQVEFNGAVVKDAVVCKDNPPAVSEQNPSKKKTQTRPTNLARKILKL